MDKSEKVKLFIDYIQSRFSDLDIFMTYSSEMDEYFIYHYNIKFDVNNIQFVDFLNNAINDYLLNYGIYNFTFGFNYDLYEKNTKDKPTLKNYENKCKNIFEKSNNNICVPTLPLAS